MKHLKKNTPECFGHTQVIQIDTEIERITNYYTKHPDQKGLGLAIKSLINKVKSIENVKFND